MTRVIKRYPRNRNGLCRLSHVPYSSEHLSPSRLEHLVALFPPLQALDALLVHFLLHLRKSLPFFLCVAFGPDRFDAALHSS
jgi:hypothetical protein